MTHIVQYIMIFIIRVYRLVLSPFIGPTCRFQPTCSEYMIKAIEEHGVIRGSIMGFRRLTKCHPLSRHKGYDPVPLNPNSPEIRKTKSKN